MSGARRVADVAYRGSLPVTVVRAGACLWLVAVLLSSALAGRAAATTLSENPFVQQGEKLTSSEVKTLAELGNAVALSEDGNTAIIGAEAFDTFKGAAFVYVRTGSTWTQQAKLEGKEASSLAHQGLSVALSADGNTAVVGGPQNEGPGVEFKGAAWVFVRSGSAWKEQQKLVGTGGSEKAGQGESVALSSSGNTALVGGYLDSKGIGAAWVFTRSGETWSQQGGKLVGHHGPEATIEEGTSVALAADGETALIGGPDAEEEKGAVWAFVLSGGKWEEQAKLPAASGAGEKPGQGFSVALSGNGNTALVGAPGRSEATGAAWVFTRSGSSWSQQAELFGEDATPKEAQVGHSVSLSADGNTALVGGYHDDVSVGAAWAFVRSGASWNEQQKMVGTGSVGGFPEEGGSVSLSADGGTALVGAPGDNSEEGAAWVFTRKLPSNEEHKEEAPPSGGGSSNSGTTLAGVSGTSAPSGIATTPKAVEELLLGCSGRSLVLNDVLIRGSRVLLQGSAAKSLDGKKVKIIFDSKSQVATATVGANGQFQTTAALPPAAIRKTNSARYVAEYRKERSLDLKLTRRLILEPPKFAAGTVTLTGQVTAPLTKPVSQITVQQELECGKTTTVKRFTPPASGRFHITVTVPGAAKAGIYRLSSTVRQNATSKRGFPTFTLPLPVIL